VGEMREFPAAEQVRRDAMRPLEDPGIRTMTAVLREQAEYLRRRLEAKHESITYEDAAVLYVCEYILQLPAGLVVSEFVPEGIQEKVREAVRLASRIRARMHYFGAVRDTDAFVGELVQLSSVLGELIDETNVEDPLMPALDEMVQAIAEDCRRMRCW
jgi:hypothetical protein